jgi:hypothetical protein
VVERPSSRILSWDPHTGVKLQSLLRSEVGLLREREGRLLVLLRELVALTRELVRPTGPTCGPNSFTRLSCLNKEGLHQS